MKEKFTKTTTLHKKTLEMKKLNSMFGFPNMFTTEIHTYTLEDTEGHSNSQVKNKRTRPWLREDKQTIVHKTQNRQLKT